MAALKRKATDKELGAVRSNLLRETNSATAVKAFTVLATWKASHLSLAEKSRELENERLAMESSDRLSLCKDARSGCGAETPATAFGRDKDGVTDATKVAPIFMGMSVDALRDHVTAKKAAFKAGGGNRRAPEHPNTPALAEEIPVNVEGKVVMLNAHDQKFCKDNNVSHIARARAKLRLQR